LEDIPCLKFGYQSRFSEICIGSVLVAPPEWVILTRHADMDKKSSGPKGRRKNI